MGQCNHEEADTRIVVHARHALETGAESILVRTVNTDIVVILVGKLYDLALQQLCKNVGRIWHGTSFLIHQHQQNMLHSQRGQSESIACIPCIHWL